MNNVITILVDSVYSQCIGMGRTKISTTPFIDSIAREGLFLKNVYSFGPYTDAATKGLYCIEPTLSDYGYFYGINSSENNHYKIFKELGYETYGLYYPYYLVSSKVEQYIDHSIYTSGFLFQSVWFGKCQYYADIYKEKGLSEREYSLLIKCFDMIFDCWLLFYKNLNNDSANVIVNTLRDKTMAATGENGLKIEYIRFRKNKKKYIQELLQQGMNHPLAHVNEFNFNKFVNRSVLKDLLKTNKSFFRKLQIISKINAILDNQIDFNKCYKSIKDYILKADNNGLRYITNYGMYLMAYELFSHRSKGNVNWQVMASMNRQIEAIADAIQKRNNPNIPFYASLHVLEPHHNISFFSYDIDDKDTLNEEIKYLTPLVQYSNVKNCGNILYQLSLRYVDLCVKRLFQKLTDLDLIDNTTILLVADHGSSYTYKNIRTQTTNNFHTENYNVPMLIWQKNMPEYYKGDFSGIFNSSDVFPILWKMLGANLSPNLFPRSLNDPHKTRDFVITEYLGPGVPDMLTKEVWISARNQEYIIGYKTRINSEFDINNPTDLFDLSADPNEKHNLASIISLDSNKDIKKMSLAIQDRFHEIQIETKNIIENFDDFCVVKNNNSNNIER